MSDPKNALLSYLRTPDDADALAAFKSAFENSDLTQARSAAKDDPASSDAAANVLGCLIRDEAENDMIVDSAKAAAQRAPRDDSGNGVTLLAAEVVWRRTGQPQVSEPYYRRVRRSDAGNPAVLAFYRELFSGEKDASQLMQVLVQARRATKDAEVRFSLAEEMSALAQERLGSTDRAIEVWRSVLREDATELRAAEHLQRLYREGGKWTALVELLKEAVDRMEATPENQELRIEKLLEIAALYREELHLDAMALATLQRVLDIDPNHRASLEALVATYEKSGRWNDLLGVVQRLIQSAEEAGEMETQVELLQRTAQIWVERLGNPQRALEPLKKIIALAPQDRDARGMMAKIHEQRRDWRALIALRREELAEREGDEALALRLELSRLSDQRLGDRTEAITDWNAVVEHHGDNDEALDALHRLYARENRWAEAAEIMHRQVARTEEPADAVKLLTELGQVYVERLSDPENAIAVWREVVRLVPGHDKATRTLRDTYVSGGRWDELTELYEGQGNLAGVVEVLNSAADRVQDVEGRVALYRRVADLCRERLKEPERAQRALERTLAIQPGNLDVARELLPIYAEQSNWARLMSTHEVLLGATEDKAEQLEIVEALRSVAADKIQSPTLAFQWAARAYELDPDAPSLRDQLESAAEAADAWDQLTRIFDARIKTEGVDQEEQLDLLAKLAVIARDKLFKPDDAQRSFRRIIEIDPTNSGAMSALEAIYTSTRRYDDLAEVYRRRLDVTDDVDARMQTLRGLAKLQGEHLSDYESATATYRQILEIAGDDREALDSLVAIHRSRGEWEHLAAVLQTKIDLGEANRDQIPLYFELAQIKAQRLSDSAGAVQDLLTILQIDPGHADTVAALEMLRDEAPSTAQDVMRGLLPYYRRVHDPAKEAAAMEVLLETEEDTAARREQLGQLATIYGKLPDRREDALRIIGELFQGEPGDWDMRQSFQRLAAELGRIDQVAVRYDAVLGLLRQKAAGAQEEGRPVDRAEATLRRDLLLEMGAILRDALGQPQNAERAFAEILEQDETHQAAYENLESLFAAREAYAELMQLYRRRVDVIFNQREQKELLSRIVDLARNVLGDRETAVRTAEELLDLIPDDLPTIQLLAGMYQEGQGQDDREKLEELLGRWAELVTDKAQRLAIQCKRAELRMQFLGDAYGAVDLLGAVLGEESGHAPARALLEELIDISEVQLQVASLLEPIYVSVSDHRGRIRVLHVRRAQAEAAGAIDEATSHLLEVARIEEHELNDLGTAFDAAREAYLMDPRRLDTLEEVERLGQALSKERELVDVWQKALGSDRANDKTLRIDLNRRIAQTLDERINDSVGARAAYMALLDLDPPDFQLAHRTVAALCRLHLEAGDFIALVDTQRALLRFTDSAGERVRIRLDIARYQLEHLLDRVGAALTWSEVLDADPGNLVALDGLEQLFTEEGEWLRLTEVLAHRIGEVEEARERAALHRRIGDIRRRELNDERGSINSFQSVLDLKVGREDSIYALQNLVDVNRGLERWPDVEEGLRRLTALADRDADRVDLLATTAELVGKQLGRGQDALDLLKRVLDLSPTDARARSLVGGYVEADDTHDRAVRILLPLYEAEQNWASMLELQELQARKQPSGRRRLQALLRVAATQEERLQDSERAFETLCAAFVEAADQPELAEILERVVRLGAEPDRAERLYKAYADTVNHILDSELQQRVLRDMAGVALTQLGRLDEARTAYERILDGHPDDVEASEALEQIYIRQGDAERLSGLLARRAERETDVERRDAYFIRAAEIQHRQLDRAEEAIGLYERLSVEGLSNSQVQDTLEPLYEQTERWEPLAKHLVRKIERLETTAKVETHLRLGRLYGEKLGDQDVGIRHLSTALRLDPDHAVGNDELGRYLEDENMRVRVAEVLEPVFAAVGDWARLVQIQEIKLEEAADHDTRVRILLRVAQIYEEQLEDLERAFEGFGRVFKEQPSNAYVRDQLSRLSHVLAKSEEYATLLSSYVDEEAVGDDRDEVLDIVREAATLWAQDLKNYARAVPLYRRILDARPDATEVFTAMEQTLIAGGLWNDLIEAYWREIDGSLDEGRQVELLMKLSNVALNAENKPAEAARAFVQVLEVQPEHAQARSSLERIYEQTEQFDELIDLLRDRLQRTEAEHERLRVQLQIAEVQNTRLDDPDAAIDTIEALLGEAPDSDDAVEALERMAEGRGEQRARLFDLLEPIYNRTGNAQRQVAVIEWRLTVVEDPRSRHELYRSLSELLGQMQNGAEYSFRALCRAVAEPGPADALADLDEALDRFARDLQVPGALSDAVVGAAGGEALAEDPDRRTQLLVKGGALQLEVGDPARAVDILRTVLELDADNEDALGLIDNALLRLGHHEELRKVLDRRITVATDDEVRRELYRRLATLLEDVLVQTEEAEKAWRGLLDIEPSDAEALQRLSRAYEQTGSTTELVEVLQRRIEASDEPGARRDLRMQLANLQREGNKDRTAEIDVLRELLSEAPSDDDGMAALGRALQAEERWAEAADVLQDRATVAQTGELKAQLMLEAARLYAGPLEDRVGAVERYEQVLQLAPGQDGALGDLVGLVSDPDVSEAVTTIVRPQLETLQRNQDLATVLAARAELSQDPEEQIAVLRELASVRYERLGDASGAYDATMALLGKCSGDELNTVLQGLMRLAAELERIESYVDSLGTLSRDEDKDPDTRVALALAGAWAATEALSDTAKALSLLTPLLDADIASVHVCDGIEQLAGASNDYALAARAVEESARQQAGEDDQADRLVRLGALRLAMGETATALDAYRDALDVKPGHAEAIAGLEALLAQPAPEGGSHGGVLDTLETAYQAGGDKEGLARITRQRLNETTGSGRLQLLANLAQTCEEGGGSGSDAIEAWGELLALDAESQHAIERLVQLAGQHEMIARAGELMLAAIEAAKADGRTSVPLSLACARVELDMLGDPAAAIRALSGVLEDQPEHPEGLDMLVAAARLSQDATQLHGALAQSAAAQGSPDRAIELWREAATVAESGLGDGKLAIEDLRQLIDHDESDAAAWQKLLALVAATEDWDALADALNRRALIASEEAERRDLRYRLANLYVEKLDRVDDAIGVYNDMIGASPDDVTAIRELEVVYRRLERWSEVRELLDRKFEAVAPEERVGVLEDMARVAESRLEDLTDAAEVLQRILAEHPSHEAAQAGLETILQREERWVDLAEILEARMNRQREAADIEAYRKSASELAELLAGRLDDTDRAQEILNGLLELDPVYVPAIISLAAVYEARGDEGAMRLTLQRAADLDPTGPVGAQLQLRLARLSDPEVAASHLEKALELDPSNVEATNRLLELSREQGKHEHVVRLLELAAGRVEDEGERRTLTLERVDTMTKYLGDVDGALRVLAAMYERVQDDDGVNQRIADALFQAERLQEAAGMYAWLVDVSGKGKRGKMPAHNLTRLAQIELAAGERELAEGHLNDSYRMDTTNVETLLTLGTVHEGESRFSDALKIYRAMLLQNAEQSGLLRRGDIYMRLFTAHMGLEEKPKAQAMLRRGIEEDPSHPQLQQALDSLGN